jgi:signal transduction histidine kinase
VSAVIVAGVDDSEPARRTLQAGAPRVLVESEQDAELLVVDSRLHGALTVMLLGSVGALAASLRHEQRFTAELSHELRTPLATISAEVELALRRARTVDECVAALEVVRRNAGQMARTMDTLVAAARQQAGLGGSSADARDAALATIATCSPLAEGRGIAIEFDAPPTALRVGVDGDLVERILQPLLENACNYGRSRIRVSAERNGSGVVVALEDDGPGVAPEERERIFEPGMRGSAPSPHAAAPGAGLGLALSRRLAHAAGGNVSLGSPESGALFLVRLPAV